MNGTTSFRNAPCEDPYSQALMHSRGQAVTNEHTPETIRSAAVVAPSISADYEKVTVDKDDVYQSADHLSKAVAAAGNTGLITSEKPHQDASEFLYEVYTQRQWAVGRTICMP